MFRVFVLIVWFHSSEVKALNCYYGRTTAESGMSGIPLVPCAKIANGCLKQDDPTGSGMTDRGCMKQGRYSPEPIYMV
ncbi:hypothetical protein DdX_18371 [Ditylenchus destructor]|uniref:Secreted protein n=1 Tax=Ditylenchus destructor TaxID=166010 RepID=A0AAD4QY86_9BILA|nr:hypothetical protein DdX_18371 [Ditylenchus destructor]